MTARVALVTGVVGGIGAAIAARLAADGAKVIVNDLPGDVLDEAADRLALPAFGADLGDHAAVRSLVQQVTAEHGAPDILVNAAGGVRGQVGTPLEEVEPDAWHSIFAINVDATLYLAQALVPAMKSAGWGRIVTISSGAGLRPSLTGIHAYTAAKHALVGLTKQLSLELGRLHLRTGDPALATRRLQDVVRWSRDPHLARTAEEILSRIPPNTNHEQSDSS